MIMPPAFPQRQLRRAPKARGPAALPRLAIVVLASIVSLPACTIGPRALQDARLRYNEVVKATTEQQLLLNIVRLRYADTPSSLSVENIAAQFELLKSLQITPFFVASGAEPNRSFTAVLPQFGIQAADRPTISLVPIDDQEFTRKLFTPVTLDGVIYLVRTTWPIGTVFRLYLENMNWVPNAEFASGPTPRTPPPFADFLRGVFALQDLQQQGHLVIATEERTEAVGEPLPATQMTAATMLEAAKNGYEWRRTEAKDGWVLVRRKQQPVLLLNPGALDSAEVREFVRIFRLKPGLSKYGITTDAVVPFAARGGLADGLEVIDLETRSLLQALYFVSHGVEVPPEHVGRRMTRVTADADGNAFDWRRVTEGLFKVSWSKGNGPPRNAHVAVLYHDYWFYIDEADFDTKSTFSLLLELSRLNLEAKGAAPIFTLPLGR
jgi:hypothetical protein